MSNVEDLYELTPMQQGMLFHALRESDTEGLYLTQVDTAMRGPVDADRLARAWQLAVDHHPALRTSIHWGADRPLQVVHRQVQLPLRQEDWRGLLLREQQSRRTALVATERNSRLDLERAPLMRLIFVRLAESEYRVIWTFHHIVLEGWSAVLVLRDVAAIYESLSRGEPVQLEARRPYRDYILWLQEQDPARSEAYWRKALEGFRTPTPLTVDRPAPSESARVQEAELTLELSESASDALRAVGKRHRLTISTIVQGAWALLLSRYSGQHDVVFGTVVSGRPPTLPGSPSMVGLFINTLAARARVDEAAGVLPWLAELQHQQAEMREYEHSSLVDVQGWSQVPRGRPLFESIVLMHTWGTDAARFLPFADRIEVGDNRWHDGATGYPLIVGAAPEARILLAATFDPSRFEPTTIERLLGHWGALLEGIAANPAVRVSELPLLTAPELAQLAGWNATSQAYPREVLLPDLIEAQVERSPAAVAVEFAGERLTYGELNGRANALARELRSLGAGPGALVGIYMERSLELLVALLGVLKAGGAYVPLDPSYPAERVSYMQEDSGASVLLTQRALTGSLPGHAPRMLCVEEVRGEAGNLERQATSEDLAYVIYTSGSTGRPKGVAVTHRSLVNFLESMRSAPGMTGEDVMLSVTTLSFDIAGLELYLPLIVGGRVMIASREEASDGERLLARLEGSAATAMQATPASWRLLLEAGWSGDRPLKILCGGEALPRDLAERLVERGSSVWNLYGPTETTIWSTLERVELDDGALTVGRPIGNTRIHVLDASGRRVPVGVPGELCIGGEGLARGYWRRADLTAERFVPDRYAGEPGARMYRTGDLARLLPDGRVEWLSRLDQQVKVRGFRIELGEIEEALGRHPAVERAVVVARGGPGGETQLVAYLVAAGGVEPTATELRKHLKAVLPVFMVPAAFVFLDELPLTPNGKVDRKSLDRLEARRQAAEDTYQPPRTPTESFLAELWREVLGLERVGLRDNFFDLGGHSLLAMKVIARVEQGLGHRLNPRDIVFQNLEQLAADCDLRRRQPEQPSVRSLTSRLFDAVRVSDGGRGA